MIQQSAGISPLSTAPNFKSRALAMWKAALYLVLALVIVLIVSATITAATGKQLDALMRSGPERALLAHAGLLLALVIVPTAISLGLWKEPLATAGWSPAAAGRLAVLGLASGAGLMALIVGTLWSSGAWVLTFRTVAIGEAFRLTLLSVSLWLIQAAHEEGLHRGYAFVQLSRALSFWVAAGISGLWFMWGHVANQGSTPVSILSAGLFALVLAYSLLRTGSLWFALGFHASWNFTQSFVFGLANSGETAPASLMTSRLNGPPLLTGGTAGPEGSLLTPLAIVILAAIVHFCLPRHPLEHRRMRA